MKAKETASKTTAQILRDNVCTLFNLLNLLIAIALIAVHAWSNLFFDRLSSQVQHNQRKNF
ncbi:MAG: hypothetical protein MR466_08170 [Ruminococcus sp.]|nr:hypothetical protein [Ruminococcus sp.]